MNVRQSQSVVYLVCLLSRGRGRGKQSEASKAGGHAGATQRRCTIAVGVRADNKQKLRKLANRKVNDEASFYTSRRKNTRKQTMEAQSRKSNCDTGQGTPKEQGRADHAGETVLSSRNDTKTTTTTTTTTGLIAGKEKMQTKTKIILPPPRHADPSSREVNTSTLTFCLAAAGWTGRSDPARGRPAAGYNKRCCATLCSGLFAASLPCCKTRTHAGGREGGGRSGQRGESVPVARQAG